MTSIEYRALRAIVGSQVKVAEALGLDHTTIQRREAGAYRVTLEAEIAMRHLASMAPVRGRLEGKRGRPFAKNI